MRIREYLSGFLVVLVMTLIVWVVADRSVLRTSREMTVSINVGVLDKAQYRATVVDPENRKMKVRFEGPGQAIDHLESRREEVTFQYTLSDAEAEQAIETGSLVILAGEGFRLIGDRITLEKAFPQKVTVRVEKVQKKTVPVALSPAVAEMVAEGWTADPMKVDAELPLSVWKKLEKEGRQLSAYLQINLSTEPARAGKEITQAAGLVPSIPGLDPDVRFVPPRVNVTFQLTAPLDNKTMDPIPILVAGPLKVLDAYEVVIVEKGDVVLIDRPDAMLKNLQVTGPAPQVAALTPESILVLLRLKENDKPWDTYQVRPLEVYLPQGSRVRFGEGLLTPKVTFNLKPRTAKSPEPKP